MSIPSVPWSIDTSGDRPGMCDSVAEDPFAAEDLPFPEYGLTSQQESDITNGWFNEQC